MRFNLWFYYISIFIWKGDTGATFYYDLGAVGRDEAAVDELLWLRIATLKNGC